MFMKIWYKSSLVKDWDILPDHMGIVWGDSDEDWPNIFRHIAEHHQTLHCK